MVKINLRDKIEEEPAAQPDSTVEDKIITTYADILILQLNLLNDVIKSQIEKEGN